MTVARNVTALLVAAFAVYAWFLLPWVKIILVEHPLPGEYYALGDASETCNVIHDPKGELAFCEDVIQGHLDGRDVLFVSCDPSRLTWNTVMGPLDNPDTRGSLWLVDYTKGKSPSLHKLALSGYEHKDFHPLGLSQFGDSLFVVNHRKQASTIEIFKISKKAPFTATHVRSVESSHLVSPNSIAATSPTSFYVTQDHLFTRRLPFPLGVVLTQVETMLALPLGWVSHVELHDLNSNQSPTWTTARNGIPFANGIAVSPNGAQVAVASSSRGKVYIFNRDSHSNKLALTSTMQLPFAGDNIGWEGGKIVIAGHPHLPKLKAVARNETGAFSGSWAITIQPRDLAPESHKTATDPTEALVPQPEDFVFRTIYQGDGKNGVQSATGAVLDAQAGKFFMSGLYMKGLLVCDVDPKLL